MIIFLLAAYSILLFALSYRQWVWSLGWLIIILPSYLIRFQIFGLPSTVLEISFAIIFLTWLIKYFKVAQKEIFSFFKKEKLFFGSLVMIFLASGVSIYTSGEWYKALGIWRAYFLEPMLFLVMLIGRKKELTIGKLTLPILISSVGVAVLAIGQKFLNFPVAPSLWNDNLGDRATSFFTSPNALGMYLAPMVVFLLIEIYRCVKKDMINTSLFWFLSIGVCLDLFAIVLSFSRGAWLALAISMTVGLFLLGHKRIGLLLAVFGISLIIFVPSVRTHVLFQDKASQNRLILWTDSWNYLSSAPKNFVFGTGLRQFFNKIERPHYNPKVIEPLTYPHNIFLNFWTETGLLGMVGVLGIITSLCIWCIKLFKKNKLASSGCIVILLTILIQGAVDVPYFKNDLAFLFWFFIFIILEQYQFFVKK